MEWLEIFRNDFYIHGYKKKFNDILGADFACTLPIVCTHGYIHCLRIVEIEKQKFKRKQNVELFVEFLFLFDKKEQYHLV